jgi:hypothetical protein
MPALLQLIHNTPTWVFGLLLLLAWLGGRQLRPTRVSLARTAVLPVAMAGLSLYGVASGFAAQPWALAAWGLVATALLALLLRRPLPAGVAYDPASRSFALPGSAVPLALLMGIFFTKYGVGVALAMHPALAHDPVFALLVCTLHGAFSGVFAGRAVRLWRLALRQGAAHGLPTAGT